MKDSPTVVPVHEFREHLTSIFRDIIPESAARRSPRVLRSFSDEHEYERARREAKVSVSELIEQIAGMWGQPFHRIRTLVRKSPILIQSFLVERIVWADGLFAKMDPSEPVPAPDFAEFLRSCLIQEYNRKLDQPTP